MRSSILKKKVLLFLTLFLLISNSYAGKNEDQYYWWRDTEIAEEIKLTPSQLNQIETIFQSQINKINDLDKDLQQKESRLKEMLNDPSSDNNEVKLLGKEVLKLKSDRKALKLDMLFGIRDVLTVDQRKILKDLKRKHK